MPSLEVLRDIQHQEEYFFSEGFTWTHLAVMVGIVLLTWLFVGEDYWRRR